MRSDIERAAVAEEKDGVFTGKYAINPFNGEKVQLWVADYVLAGYGTGTVMAVPGHDARDFVFAKQYDLPILEVVRPPAGTPGLADGVCFTGDGTAVNSGPIDGLPSPEAIRETIQIMEGLRARVPQDELEQKRLDALNSFVFNVDTPAALVETYGRYALREEPLDTLERIQDAFITSTEQELEALAKLLLDPQKLQIFIVADKTTKIKAAAGVEVTLEEDLKQLAQELGLPYREIPLR